MNEIHLGSVKFFNSQKDKLFGFATTTIKGKEEDLFFHFKDGVKMDASGGEPRFSERGEAPIKTLPEEGDLIVFSFSYGLKGLKASPWSFERDYREAEKEIQAHDLSKMLQAHRRH